MSRNEAMSQTERSMICTLYRRGVDIADLVERYGGHESTIRSVLRKAGVTLQKPW